MEVISQLSIEDWKNLANILFFVSATIVAWLSYISVKKSILSPMKNEILKYQLEDINRVLLAFKDKGSISSFHDDFDLLEVSKINCHFLISQYLDVAFAVAHSHVDNAYVIKNEKLKSFDNDIAYIVPGVYREQMLNQGVPNLKDATYWDEKYTVVGVYLSKKCYTKIQDIEQLASSPLLPEELIKLIDNFSEKLEMCWISMIKGLRECKAQLNFEKETKLELSDYEIRCMWEDIINSTETMLLNEHAEKITTYVRDYLKVNKIMH
jgi:hypothetical protein